MMAYDLWIMMNMIKIKQKYVNVIQVHGGVHSSSKYTPHSGSLISSPVNHIIRN